MDELELLATQLDKLAVDSQARMSYDLFAGGLVWSDEIPAWDEAVRAGLGHFRALLNHRTSLIRGIPGERFLKLWERARQLCPNWPGFLPGRQDSALAEEARARGEASLRSFEELDERYRQQQQAKARSTPA